MSETLFCCSNVYFIGPSGTTEYGWVEYQQFLTSLSCSICGQTGGQRVVGLHLDENTKKLLEPLLGEPVAFSIFERVRRAWIFEQQLSWYEAMPGDSFGPAIWHNGPRYQSEICFPTHAPIVIGPELEESLHDKFSDTFALIPIIEPNELSHHGVLAPAFGPWNRQVYKTDLEPRCSECNRNLGTHHGIASQLRSQYWKSRTLPRMALPDAVIMKSLFGPGVIVTPEIFALFEPFFDEKHKTIILKVVDTPS